MRPSTAIFLPVVQYWLMISAIFFPRYTLNKVSLLISIPALTPVNRQRKRGVSLPALRVLYIRVSREPSDSYEVVHLRSSFAHSTILRIT